MSWQRIILGGLAVILLGGAHSSAQTRQLDHSDIEFNPRSLELAPGLPGDPFGLAQSCFPVYDSWARVHVVVYESVRGNKLGDLPTRRPMPELERRLTERLQAVYPSWTFGETADVVIEVMVVRERDGAWTVITTWSGLGRQDPVGGCRADLRSERTDDLEQALSHIVRLMATGEEIPSARP
jgi:hypothetical protein